MDRDPPAKAGDHGLAAQVRAGGRRAVAQAITLIESTRPGHRRDAEALLTELAPAAGGAVRVGLSGVPGAGKSTLIEALGNHVIERGHRVAVLAVDPTSTRSGGSILGDKTRMETLARRPEAFIRPSPTGRTLGGVTRRTREAIIVCEAAGFGVVVVETVGVGQSEAAVADMTDLFVLMLAPGAGDELQGIKRGIVELADLVLINKADGELEAAARRAAADYRHALELLRGRSADWQVPVMTCSALTGAAVPEVWDTMARYHESRRASGALERRRAEQARHWLWSETAETLTAALRADPRVRARAGALEEAVARGEVPASVAAHELLEAFGIDPDAADEA